MNCPICNGKTKIIDVRHVRHTTRRRRECVECLTRFTTLETIERRSLLPYVRKKLNEEGVLL